MWAEVDVGGDLERAQVLVSAGDVQAPDGACEGGPIGKLKPEDFGADARFQRVGATVGDNAGRGRARRWCRPNGPPLRGTGS